MKYKHKPSIRCLVEIRTREGQVLVYHGLYRSTCDAVIDAIERFGFGKLSVKVKA